MPFTLKDLVLGGVLPFFAAFLIYFLLQNNRHARRHAASYAVGGAFVLGYFLLGLGPLVPQEHWQWVPHLTLLAMAFGPVICREKASLVDRVLICAIHCTFLALLVVPAWASLDEVRSDHWIYLGVGAWLLMLATMPLGQRNTGPLFSLLIAFTVLAAGIVVAASGSLRFMQIVSLGSVALLGCTLVMVVFHRIGSIQSAIPLVVTLVGGVLYAARVNSFSEVPLFSYLIPCLAPLALWVPTIPQVARLPKLWLAMLQIVLVLVPVAFAVFAALAAMPVEEEW